MREMGRGEDTNYLFLIPHTLFLINTQKTKLPPDQSLVLLFANVFQE